MINPQIKKILLPTDGSDYANKAAKHAMWLARMTGAEIIVLNVIETILSMGLPEGQMVIEIEDILEDEGHKTLEKTEDILKETKFKDECQKEVKLTKLIERGSSSQVIVETAKKECINLIVMGTSGKHGFDKFLLGSTAEKVLKSAPCSVLVVH